MEFTVLDDNAPVNDNDHSDLIGTARITLSKLLFSGGRIDESLKIINKNGEIKGNLIVKVFWYHTEEDNIRGSVANGISQMFSGGDNIKTSVANGVAQLLNRGDSMKGSLGTDTAQMLAGNLANTFNYMNDSKGILRSDSLVGGAG